MLFARLRDHAHSVLADIGLADALTATGDFDEALRIYARARMRASQRGLALQLAMIDESVALLDLARGRYREALAGLASARSRYQTLAVPHCLAIAEKQLGDAYLELRLLPEAQALFDTAVRRFGELALADEAAWALAQRARTEAMLGQAAAAALSLSQASALFDREGNAVGSATVALARAELACADGQAGAALAQAEQARRGFVAAGQADGQARAEVLCAQSLWLAGRHDEARRGFEAALAGAIRLQQWPVQQRCLTGLGLAALADGQPQAASAHFEAAIDAFAARRRAPHRRSTLSLAQLALLAWLAAGPAAQAATGLAPIGFGSIANGQYRIPGSNPFQGSGQVKEIVAHGFRNPYRFSGCSMPTWAPA